MKKNFFAYLFNPLIKQIWKKVSIVKRLFWLFQCSKNQLCNLYNCSGKCCLFVFREKSIFHIFSVSCFKIYWPLKPPQRDKQVHRTKSHHKEFLLICISFNNSHPTYLNTQQKAFSYMYIFCIFPQRLTKVPLFYAWKSGHEIPYKWLGHLPTHFNLVYKKYARISCRSLCHLVIHFYR